MARIDGIVILNGYTFFCCHSGRKKIRFEPSMSLSYPSDGSGDQA